MSLWTYASTFLLFPTPANTAGAAFSAVGENRLLSADQFEKIWGAFFFGEKSQSPLCGSPRETGQSDSYWMERDAFLVHMRGFRPSLCKQEAWFVASMRLDPCRLRLGRENKTQKDVHACSRSGEFNEVRFVLQPVEKTDRGYIFPDAALHLAYSIPNLKETAKVWRSSTPSRVISFVKEHGRPTEASLFLGGAGVERWTFARLKFSAGTWLRDALPHGGFYESLTDADLSASGQIRTQRPAGEQKFTDAQLLNPLQINPLQGSCISCHLAGRERSSRLFRQLGWGLSGENVVSDRVRAEAEFAARELNIFNK